MRNTTSRQLSCLARLCRRSVLAGLAALVPTVGHADARVFDLQFQPSPSQDVVGYTLHLGKESRLYPISVDIGAPPNDGSPLIVYRLYLDDASDTFVAVSSYDQDGLASTPSNEIRVAAVATPPPPPPNPNPNPVPEPGPGPGDPPTPPPPPYGPQIGSSAARIALTATGAGMIRAARNDGSLLDLTLDSLAGSGDLRPASCDLDGDGDADLAIGFGPGSDGQIALLFFDQGAIAGARTIVAGDAAYHGADGQTHPSCGDIDGDGRPEIVVGMGPAANEMLHVFDDELSDFSDFDVRGSGSPQLAVPTSPQIDAVGAGLIPALGDIDGDGRDEIIVGFDAPLVFDLAVLDDAETTFFVHETTLGSSGPPLMRVARPDDDLSSGGGTFPAAGDFDGDGLDEVAVGFGPGSGGRVTFIDDTLHNRYITKRDFLMLPVGREDYRANVGASRPAFGDIDDDGREELIVGFSSTGAHELQIFDDMLRIDVRALLGGRGFARSDDPNAILIPAPAAP